MAKQKWDRVGCAGRGDWQLRAEHCHPDVFVYVEHIGYGGRAQTGRYRVRIVGPLATAVLVYKHGRECYWTLNTAKRKAEWVADYTTWLVMNGVVEGEKADV